MNYTNFLDRAKQYPVFKVQDVFKWYPNAKKRAVLNQLHLWTKKGYLERLKKGIYKLRGYEIKDPFTLAGFLYSPSYISLESALNVLGVIPDIPFSVTSVTLAKTKIFRLQEYGVFSYQHIKPELFFGFQTVEAPGAYLYAIASAEKALFDYLYLKTGKVKSPKDFLEGMRMTLPSGFTYQKIRDWSKIVDVRKKSFHSLIQEFMRAYDQ